jgi:HK97 family phage prohead protease
MTKGEDGYYRMPFIASTTDEDSHGTIIEQDWKLDRYRNNPVVLFNHKTGGGFWGEEPPTAELIPIGTGEDIRVAADQLKVTVAFPPEGRDPRADMVRIAVEDGRLNAMSVGFRPGKVVEEKNNDTGKTRFRLSKNELYEVSICPLGSNANTVAERDAEAVMLRSLASLHAPTTPAAASGSAALPQEAAPAAATRSAENSMSLDILLRALGLAKDADINAGIDAIHALTQKVADADKRAATAEQRATSVEQSAAPVIAFRTATLAALSLPEGASQGDVTGAIVKLTGRAAKADELETQNTDLSKRADALAKEVATLGDAVAKREIDWIVTRGKDYDVPGGEKIRKSLEAHRQSDPTGFAETYKPALDGLRAFDNEDLFKVRSVVGQSPTQSTPAAGRSNGSDLSARAEAFVQRKAKAGVTISLPEALQAVAYGEDC